VERLLLGSNVSDAHYDALDRLEHQVEQVMREDFVKSRSGQSAVLALVTALEDEYYESDDLDCAWLDSQRGQGDEDASSAASIAYSAGTALMANSDPDRRLRFWRWWLTEAVADAYLKGTEK
jgi:hypothetical protein